MSVPIHSQRFEIELTNGNDGRSKTWFKPAKERIRIERYLSLCGFSRSPFDIPVRVVVTRILGPRQSLWDSSSGLRGNYKEIEDALVAVGWFHDDNPQWITETVFRQDASDRKNGPAILIEVYESK